MKKETIEKMSATLAIIALLISVSFFGYIIIKFLTK